jgi:hypothetical protein
LQRKPICEEAAIVQITVQKKPMTQEYQKKKSAREI